jgi:hypothetical protein
MGAPPLARESHEDVEVWRRSRGGTPIPETTAARPTPEKRQAGDAAHQMDAPDATAQVRAAQPRLGRWAQIEPASAGRRRPA